MGKQQIRLDQTFFSEGIMQALFMKKRSLFLLIAVVGQCLGNFPSAWAVYQPYVALEYGYTSNAATLVMSICVVFYGIIAILGGLVIDHLSPRTAALIGVAAIALSFFNAWWIPAGNPLYLYLGFCLFYGGGCGFFMQAITSTLIKYYADKSGFAVGFSGACCAVYIILLTYVSELMITRLGVRRSFLAMGVLTIVIGLFCAWTMISPTPAYITERIRQPQRSTDSQCCDLAPAQMLRTRQYYLLVLSFLFIIPAFQLINPQLVSLCVERGLTKEAALTATATASAATALGRFLIPSLSDRLGRKRTVLVMWAATASFTLLFMGAEGPLIAVSWALVSLVYSGGFALLSSFTSDLFGLTYAGSNLGLTNLSNTIGSLIGPLLLTAASPMFGEQAVYHVGIGCAALAFLSMLFLNTNLRKQEALPVAAD